MRTCPPPRPDPSRHPALRAAVGSLCLVLLLAAPLVRAQGVLLTLLDGEATVIDGTQRVAAVAGLAIEAGAIVETGPASALVRLEWPDGAVADLGGATRLMVAPPGWPARGGRPPLVYLLQGWVKVSASGREPAGGVVTPAFEVGPIAGAAVVVTDRRERHAFAESGSIEVIERPAGKRSAVVAGASYAGAAGVLPRPDADFLARVPRAFRDPIPRRAASFAQRRVVAPALPAPTYAQLADWLGAEPAIRRDFPRRFAEWASEPAFRQGLLAHEAAHPEWRPVLHPPPPPSSPAR